MKIASIVCVALGFLSTGVAVATAQAQSFERCLPKDIKLTDVVSTRVVSTPNGDVVQRSTVQQELAGLKALCNSGQLVDQQGRQIVFYWLTGCWGNPPRDYQEILDQQRVELSRLRTRYRVVEMTCNPSGRPIS